MGRMTREPHEKFEDGFEISATKKKSWPD